MTLLLNRNLVSIARKTKYIHGNLALICGNFNSKTTRLILLAIVVVVVVVAVDVVDVVVQ